MVRPLLASLHPDPSAEMCFLPTWWTFGVEGLPGLAVTPSSHCTPSQGLTFPWLSWVLRCRNVDILLFWWDFEE